MLWGGEWRQANQMRKMLLLPIGQHNSTPLAQTNTQLRPAVGAHLEIRGYNKRLDCTTLTLFVKVPASTDRKHHAVERVNLRNGMRSVVAVAGIRSAIRCLLPLPVGVPG